MKTLNLDNMVEWTIFIYKQNRHIVLWTTNVKWVYTIDIDWDVNFSSERNEVFFLDYWDILEDSISNNYNNNLLKDEI